ncbi:ferritin-like domain-containing protein [Crucibulum laeve]|uniref:Ferritin-like domain-containing protein n=1 Tax=Crucibulum laeve TaxID=68775 RepID=A0A5C3M113_9AGAR|nr:ferritin-like domain-containing protein [Crucibulum laeve]
MKFSTLFSFALAALSVNALPKAAVQRRADAIDDTTVLNFALTLEHLENAFYAGALEKFDEGAFKKAGLPSWARGRFVQIAAHEAAHVKFLSDALGDKATKPCTYNFPYTDPKTFAALSMALEGVGVSAYAGAAQFITNKQYLTAAAVVLSTEARHASWVAGAVNKLESWSGALDVPLGLNQVFTLAASFITSCPSTNPALPVKAFPTLTLTTAGNKAGSSGTVAYNGSSSASGTAVAFYTGLSTIFAPIKDGKFTLPEGLMGTVYAVVSSNATSVSDESILAGPAILEINFNSDNTLVKK